MVTNYKKKQVDADFSGIGGLMKLIELFAGGKPAEKAAADKRIAVVYAVGEIVEGKSASDMFGEAVAGLDHPDRSPPQGGRRSQGGGHRAPHRQPRRLGHGQRPDLAGDGPLKKPLIASMGDVAGSGGYYIAMAARKIVAEPGTITGSIGVIGGKLVTGGLYDKLGLTTEVISRGKNSGSLSSTPPFTPDERKAWTALLEETYGQFVSKAAQGRKMDRKQARGTRPGTRLHRADGQEERPGRRTGHAPGRHRRWRRRRPA